LGHWLQIAGGKIAQYQVITPTCWNVSPKDTSGQRGPLEQALIGTPVNNVDQPIEVLRVVHSFDPCLDCATHVMRAEAGAKVYALGTLPTAA
jgi:hydrogenase large subunit